MVKWDASKNLLVLTGIEGFKRKLEKSDEPNLFRDIFPYVEVPRITFDYKFIPPCPPREIFITDTTFRDGQQARPPYTVEQIVKLYEFLHQLGGKAGLIRQTEFFLYSKKDKEAVEKCKELGYRFPEITGWIRANKEDLKLVKLMELEETGILTSVSDYHIFLKLKKDRKKAMDDYLAIVKEALNYNIVPRCHFEDATRADVYGFCVPFAIELMKLADDAKSKVKIRICDTLGFGVPYPCASLPRAVDKWIRAMIEDAGVPEEWLEWHGHNDFHKVLTNAVTAWLYGCCAVNGTLFGFGERTGNPPIEGLVIEYLALKGENPGVNTTVITEIADYYRKEIGGHIPPNYPFVGSEFNVTRAGIHADGMLKDEEIYNIFDTNKLLNRPIDILINDKSGTAGIAWWVNKHFNLEGDKRIDKRHPGIIRLAKWVEEQYKEGRETAISHQEMKEMVTKYLPELFVSEFERLKQHAHHMASGLIEKLVERKDIRSMVPRKIEPVLRKFIEENPFIQFIYVVNTDGKKITHNITHPEDRAEYEKLGMDFDYSDRPWFKAPLKDGKVFVSDLYTSKVTNRLCVTVSGPILDKDEKEIVGVLGADIMFEELVKYDEMVEREKNMELTDV